MLDCLILGDSIAVGTQQARPDCVAYAKVGINSRDWVNQNVSKDLTARAVIISLGSNDYPNIKTESELLSVRQLVQAERVYWILPAIKPNIQDIVKKVAAHYGDTVLPIQHLQPDSVHPTWAGYKAIAQATR